MNEKKITEGKFNKINMLTKAFCAIGVVTAIAGILFAVAYDDASMGGLYGEKYKYLLDRATISFVAAGVLIGLGILVYFMLSRCSLTVTDKKISGNTIWGMQVDFPVDKITAISYGALNSVVIVTASKKTSFWYMENKEEVFQVISELISNQKSDTNVSNSVSDADELKKYKELLDNGVISQEEFDAKKKQLLGL